MEEARKKLFQKAIRTFEFQNLVRHQTIGSGQKNLVELISRYPQHGNGFKVYKKTWPEDSYWQLKDVQMLVSLTNFAQNFNRTCTPFFDVLIALLFQNGRNARLYGVQFWKGKMISKKVEQVPGVLKRGMWQYTVDENMKERNVTLDNNNKYDVVDLNQKLIEKNNLIKGRKQAMEYKTTAEPE